MITLSPSLRVHSSAPDELAALIGPAQNRPERYMLERIASCVRMYEYWRGKADSADMYHRGHYEAMAREAAAEARALASAVFIYRQESTDGAGE